MNKVHQNKTPVKGNRCITKAFISFITVAGFDNGSLPVSVLKSLVLLGVNSSGKSNLFKGFDLMRNMVMHSAVETEGSKISKIEPFRLNTKWHSKNPLLNNDSSSIY